MPFNILRQLSLSYLHQHAPPAVYKQVRYTREQKRILEEGWMIGQDDIYYLLVHHLGFTCDDVRRLPQTETYIHQNVSIGA